MSQTHTHLFNLLRHQSVFISSPLQNSRLFMIRRLANQVPEDKLNRLVDSLQMSKLRHGLQLCTKVRTSEEEMKSQMTKLTQIAQNKVLRLLDNSKISDKISIKKMTQRMF